jgi:hypothetical protein
LLSDSTLLSSSASLLNSWDIDAIFCSSVWCWILNEKGLLLRYYNVIIIMSNYINLIKKSILTAIYRWNIILPYLL